MTTGQPEPPPGGNNSIFEFQKRHYHIFWDEDYIHNEVITKYTHYYSPATIEDETVWKTTKCPPGTFVSKYLLRNPKSCYYQGRRIMELTFNCTKVDGSESTGLDMYDRFRVGHTLQEQTIAESKECKNGYYTSFRLYYSTIKEYTYLVDGFAFEMICSIGGSVTPHKVIHKALIREKPVYIEETEVVQCVNGSAVCGFESKIIDDHVGTFEGFFFKVLCCPV